MTEPAAPAAAPQISAPQPNDDDSIIGDILKADPKEPSGDAEGGDDGDAPEAEAQADEEHESEDTTDADAEPADDTEPEDAVDPDTSASILMARQLVKEGRLDEAFEMVFGCKPEKLYPNDKVWTKWRAANNKREQAIRTQETQVAQREQQTQQWVASQRQQISGIIEQLRPYEEIHLARVAFQQSGDPELLKAIIEKTSGMSYDEAQKAILTKSRRSPGERALQQQVQTLMQKLEEAEKKKAEEAQQQTTQQQYANDIGIITSTLKGEVTKVPRFAERVYQVLVKTRTPTGLSMSIEDAGRRVLAAERRKLATHPLVAKPAPKNPVSAAASTLAKAKKAKQGAAPVLRRDSRTNGTVDEKSETTDDILKDILPSGKKRATAL